MAQIWIHESPALTDLKLSNGVQNGGENSSAVMFRARVRCEYKPQGGVRFRSSSTSKESTRARERGARPWRGDSARLRSARESPMLCVTKDETCAVKTCIGVLLFSLVDKELFRTLRTMLTTSGHSSAYIFSSDSTARKSTYDLLACRLDSAVRPRATRRSEMMLGLEFLLYTLYYLFLEVAASVRYP
jgi:hypothetical protein